MHIIYFPLILHLHGSGGPEDFPQTGSPLIHHLLVKLNCNIGLGDVNRFEVLSGQGFIYAALTLNPAD